MIDTLYVNGCSWTVGNELEQDPTFLEMLAEHSLHLFNPDDPLDSNLVNDNGEIVSTLFELFNDYVWAGKLKKLLNIPNLINDSIGGASNARILRTTIDFLLQLPKDKRSSTLVVIGWTVTERDEIFLKNNWHRFNLTQKFSNILDRTIISDEEFIKKVDKFQEDYVANIYEDISGIQKYFQGVYLLSNLLENLGICYYFFSALPQWWTAGELQVSCNVEERFPIQAEWYESHSNIHAMRDNMFVFVRDHQFLLGKYGHPLLEGHTAWATHLLPFIKKIL